MFLAINDLPSDPVLPAQAPLSNRDQDIARANFLSWMALCSQYITATPLSPDQEEELWREHYHPREIDPQDVPGYPFK